MIPRRNVLVAVFEHPDYELRLAREFGLGAEVGVFAWPEVLATDFRDRLKRMARRVNRLDGIVGCHGPFVDTMHTTLDAEILKVVRRRYIEAFDIAESLGARFIVFHSQYNVVVRIPSYPELYHKQSLRFWPDIIRQAERRDIDIYIENMFDDSPAPLRRLADALDSERLNLCLDPAHCLVYSELDLSEWIAVFGPHLRHVHLSDSNGVYDDHLGLGQGCLRLPETMALFKKAKRNLTYTLETGKHTRASLRRLGLDEHKK